MSNTLTYYLAWIWTVLWLICYPIGLVVYYAGYALWSLALLLYRPLAVLLQPLVYFGNFILTCLAAP